ncbi:NAD(P)/FAD-dependent oxidoreductase [Shimia sp.]|uniref:NAD(P)/FAD-dependent oxidoreductase n=1 Tax=Shimia sp. TaxID=1954381 RepID=UPI003BA937B2
MATLVIGGGVVGLSIAYGLLKQGREVIVIDGSDTDARASRGNFGLVWIQGKGLEAPPYASWSRQSAGLWKQFSDELKESTNIDVAFSQIGGVEYFTEIGALEQEAADLSGLREKLGGDYPFEMLDHAQLKKLVPEIGLKVAGGIFSPMDGHVNPLLLLRALTEAVKRLGGRLQTGHSVTSIEGADHSYSALLADGTRIDGDALVLAAGLGSAEHGEDLGFKAPVRAQQGQVLITEKLPFFLKYPSGRIRQVNEGGVQIGASKAETDSEATDLSTLQELARYAVDVFPLLEHVQLVRSWAALRVMSPDGLPIYQRSAKYAGAHFVTCHSGITLAAAHAGLLPEWIDGRNTAPDLTFFSESRFDV